VSAPAGAATNVSVVIPTLDEAAHILAYLGSVGVQPVHVETIVVDGGSTDHTSAIAEAAGATVLRSPRGRGTQLIAGAPRHTPRAGSRRAAHHRHARQKLRGLW